MILMCFSNIFQVKQCYFEKNYLLLIYTYKCMKKVKFRFFTKISLISEPFEIF